MVKKIHLNFDNINNPDYEIWTKEAVGEFLDLFPAYKDLFEITTESIEADKKLFQRSFSKDDLKNLVDIAVMIHDKGTSPDASLEQKLRDLFTLQADGTYKYQSSPDPSSPDRNITRSFLLLAEQKVNGQEPDYSFPIEICFGQTSNSGCYGEGGMMAGVMMYLNTFEDGTQGKDAQYKKDFFKMLLKHELGHTFQACPKGAQRQLDTSETGMGHCTHDDCLMLSGDKAHEAFEKNRNITFCDDCKKEIEQHLRMIKDPNQHEFTNDTNSAEPTDGQDYDEPDNPNMPELVRILKAAYKEHDITMRATKEKQEDYPYSYNLYKRGEKPADGATPTGRITITNEKNITLKSKDINHFVVAMNAVKQRGGDAIRLNLSDKASDEECKAFAAHAVIAGMIAGIEVKNNPYSLDELKEINPMIEKVIKLTKQKEDAKNAAAALESNTDTAKEPELEKTLGTSIDEAFGTYQQLSKDALPNFDSLKKFECGVNAVQRAKTRRVAQQILAQRQTRNRS